MKKKIIISILILGIVSLAIVVGINLYINTYAKKYIERDIKDLKKVDAILVLGAFVYENNKPSPILEDRLDYGYELYRNNKAKKIVVSGDHGTKGYDEVSTMRDYLLDKGVPRKDIFLDHAGFDTYDSMYRAKEIFGIESMIVSTQKFHINRSIYIGRKLGIEVYGYPSEDKKEYKMNYLNFRESLAKVKAFTNVEILKRKPKYLGDKIDINGNGIVTD